MKSGTLVHSVNRSFRHSVTLGANWCIAWCQIAHGFSQSRSRMQSRLADRRCNVIVQCWCGRSRQPCCRLRRRTLSTPPNPRRPRKSPFRSNVPAQALVRPLRCPESGQEPGCQASASGCPRRLLHCRAMNSATTSRTAARLDRRSISRRSSAQTRPDGISPGASDRCAGSPRSTARGNPGCASGEGSRASRAYRALGTSTSASIMLLIDGALTGGRSVS